MFGGVAEIGIAKGFFVQLEPMYVQKGFKLEGTGGKATFKADFLAIPVLAKAKFDLPGSQVKPYVFAGPNIGFKLSSK